MRDWEKTQGEETWTHGNWTASDHDDHWHLYWVDEGTPFNDWPLTLLQVQILAAKMDDVLGWSMREQRP